VSYTIFVDEASNQSQSVGLRAGRMGYHHVALKFKCGKCGRTLLWKSVGSLPTSRAAVCPCGAVNHVSLPDQWAKVPQYLWLGPDKHARFKLYATPPEHGDEGWALPYSIRS